MEYEVTDRVEIDFGASGIEATLQNVSFLIGSLVESFPMDRSFGWAPDVDAPFSVVESSASAQLIELIHQHEPTVEVVEVIIQERDVLNGILKPIVRVSINE